MRHNLTAFGTAIVSPGHRAGGGLKPWPVRGLTVITAGTINITWDERGRCNIAAPLSNDDLRKLSLTMLAKAIEVIANHSPAGLIVPMNGPPRLENRRT